MITTVYKNINIRYYIYLFPLLRTDSKGKNMNKILKILVQTICIFLILIPATVFSAGNKADTCDTRHPVILAHGTGGADKLLGIVDYWWGISDALENEGAEVFITRVDGMGGTEEKAEQFRDEFLKIQTMCPPETKFNIIILSFLLIAMKYAQQQINTNHRRYRFIR